MSPILGAVVVATVFLLGAVHRFSLPQLPIATSDVGYFWSALNKLAGGKFEPLNGVNFLYPLIVYLVLWLFDEFRPLGVIQHVLGLAAGVVFLCVWRCLGKFTLPTVFGNELHRWLGIVGLAIYLLSNGPLQFESLLRADAVCMFMGILSVWLSLESICDSVVRVNRRRAGALAVASIVSCVTLATFKPSFVAAASAIILVTAFVTLRHARSPAIAMVIVSAIVVTAVVSSSLHSYFSRGDSLTKIFLPQTLFSIHANIIYEQMREEVWQENSNGASAVWLQQACSDLGAAIEETHARFPKPFARLGFDPDRLVNGWDERPSLLSRWRAELGDDRYREFLSYWYWHTLQRRPIAFMRKTGGQLSVFYSLDCPAFWGGGRLLRFPYERTISTFDNFSLQSVVRSVPAAQRFVIQTRELLRTAPPESREGEAIHFLNKLCGRTYLAALLLSLIACLWWRNFTHHERTGVLLVIFLYALNLGNVLSISIVHSMEIGRYSGVQFLSALLAELWAVLWLYTIVDRAIRQRQTSTGLTL
ncbi:MAG: hypothetical protein H0X73_02040 [Chthoniobacterales bacterium]|nr:hypothetical protein [Chthoniobacterales bacterium]